MTVTEFYDYITKQMTNKEALIKLLEGHLVTYEKLKFEDGKEIHPLMVVALAAMDMGWIMTIEKDKEEVEGIMIGTKNYMERSIK